MNVVNETHSFFNWDDLSQSRNSLLWWYFSGSKKEVKYNNMELFFINISMLFSWNFSLQISYFQSQGEWKYQLMLLGLNVNFDSTPTLQNSGTSCQVSSNKHPNNFYMPACQPPLPPPLPTLTAISTAKYYKKGLLPTDTLCMFFSSWRLCRHKGKLQLKQTQFWQ